MRKIVKSTLGWLAAAAIAVLCLSQPGFALAQQNATSAVGSVVDFRTSSPAYSNDIYVATQSEIGRRGGFGPSVVTSNTIIGTQNIYSTTTHNGPETNSNGTNVLNSSTIATTNTIGANGSNVSILANTGATQNSGNASQGTDADNATTLNGGSHVSSSTSQ